MSTTQRTKVSQNLCIHHLLQMYAVQTPDAIAIAAPEQPSLTYGRLFTHIDDVVQTLNAMGVGRNDRVAIVLPNGPELVVTFIAVAAGATSAPLNPAYRANEFEFYLSDLNAKALIVQSGMDSPARAVAQTQDIPIIELSPALDAEAGIFTLVSDECSAVDSGGPAHLDDVALVLHTSGTTSRPKMVPLTQTNICTSAHNIRATLELTENDRCLNVMPLFHIHGLIGATLSSLTAGASVVCTPGFDAAQFFEWLKTFRPTWYTAVPTMHQAIVHRAASNTEDIARCPLRLIRSSSSALPPKVMAALEDVFNVPVIESYGMTEASHQMASNPLPPQQRKPGSVGVAAGPEITIMDEGGNLLPVGETGEIVIRGTNVTLGYENNPTANESVFTDGWFRTGDQGYLDTDAYLFITGRIKEIINRGGEKISPREVDEALLEHPTVAQAVTFAVPHEKLGEDVAAAVVLHENTSATEREIRDLTFSRLADYKVPSQVLIIDEIPKGPTGKLQRIGLAEKLSAELNAEFVAPRNALELQLTQIWEQVLDKKPISVRDNFFYLGGDSLIAARLFTRIEKTFDKNLPLATLFQAPSVEQFAEVLRQEDSSSLWSSLVAIQPGGSKPPFFCVHGCDGHVLLYRDLARHLGADQPVYGLQAVGLSEAQAPHTHLSDMAAHYLKEIRTLPPQGPYFVGGHGVGGLVAFEMAQQLNAQEQNMALLVLMDGHPPQISSGSTPLVTQKSLTHYLRRSVHHLQRGQFTRVLKGFFRRRMNDRLRPRRIQRVRKAILDAAESYVPRDYACRIAYFAPETRKGSLVPSQTRIDRWRRLAADELVVRKVPGDHFDMLKEPHVRALADELKACLDEARAEDD